MYKFSSLSGRLPVHFFKIWYTAILQRQLAYACGVWFPHITQSHGVCHLLAAQKKALLLISRTYKNTASSALQVLTGIPPLDLQLEAEAEFTLVTRLGGFNNALYCTTLCHQNLKIQIVTDFRYNKILSNCKIYRGNSYIYRRLQNRGWHSLSILCFQKSIHNS